MIHEQDTARGLQQALTNLEHKRKNLADAPDEELLDRANEYEQARRDATPAFAAASAEFDAGEVATGSQPASSPGAEVPPTAPAEAEQAATPTEASPGVPLIKPPGVPISAATLEQYGPLRKYRSKVDPAIEIEATPYAFAEGTAIETGMAEGTVATAQPSRIIRNGEELGIQANDVFNQHYDFVEDDAEKPQSEVPSEAQNPPVEQAEAAAPETPAGEGADQAPPSDPPAAEVNQPADEAGPPSAETQV